MNTIRNCTACGRMMVFLESRSTGKYIPVLYSLLTAEERGIYEAEGKVYFSGKHHESHFKSCSDPNRFSKNKKREQSNDKKRKN